MYDHRVEVLVVEDSSAMRTFVRAALEDDLDAVVTEAESGFEALRELPRRTFDVVLADINMPDINGLELVAFIRNSDHHRGTPVILMSTEASKRDRQRGLELGANAFLSKPFEANALIALIRSLTEDIHG